jgi:hypothetical protein
MPQKKAVQRLENLRNRSYRADAEILYTLGVYFTLFGTDLESDI